MKALLLGIGNILLSDEGVGVRTVEYFEQCYRHSSELEILDGGTAGMELLAQLANRELVVIVDAVLTGDSPGTIVSLTDTQVPAFFSQKISPHQLGLSDLLSALIMTGEQPKKLILLGVVPESIELGIGLTPTIQAQLEPLVKQIADQLTLEGLHLYARLADKEQV